MIITNLRVHDQRIEMTLDDGSRWYLLTTQQTVQAQRTMSTIARTFDAKCLPGIPLNLALSLLQKQEFFEWADATIGIYVQSDKYDSLKEAFGDALPLDSLKEDVETHDDQWRAAMQQSDAARDFDRNRIQAELMEHTDSFVQLAYDTRMFRMNLREGRTSLAVLEEYIQCFPPYISTVLRVCHLQELLDILSFIEQMVI